MRKKEKLLFMLELHRDMLKLNQNTRLSNSNNYVSIMVGIALLYFGVVQISVSWQEMNEITKYFVIFTTAAAVVLLLWVYKIIKHWASVEQLAVSHAMNEINKILKELKILKEKDAVEQKNRL